MSFVYVTDLTAFKGEQLLCNYEHSWAIWSGLMCCIQFVHEKSLTHTLTHTSLTFSANLNRTHAPGKEDSTPPYFSWMRERLSPSVAACRRRKGGKYMEGKKWVWMCHLEPRSAAAKDGSCTILLCCADGGIEDDEEAFPWECCCVLLQQAQSLISCLGRNKHWQLTWRGVSLDLFELQRGATEP